MLKDAADQAAMIVSAASAHADELVATGQKDADDARTSVDNELESTRIKVNAACPGFTATDLNKFRGTRTVEQGAREPVRLALLDANGPTGSFSNEDGPLPW